jgi:hypothetical protein
MGSDPMAVVDDELRVRELDRTLPAFERKPLI